MTIDWETMPVGTADTLRDARDAIASLETDALGPGGSDELLAKIDAILAQLTPRAVVDAPADKKLAA